METPLIAINIKNENHLHGWTFSFSGIHDVEKHFELYNGNLVKVKSDNKPKNGVHTIKIIGEKGSLNTESVYQIQVKDEKYKAMLITTHLVFENAFPSWGNDFKISFWYEFNARHYNNYNDNFVLLGFDEDNCIGVHGTSKPNFFYYKNNINSLVNTQYFIDEKIPKFYHITLQSDSTDSSKGELLINGHKTHGNLDVLQNIKGKPLYVLLESYNEALYANKYNNKLHHININLNGVEFLNF